MGRELMRKLLQAHLELRQPGKAVEAVRDAAGTTYLPPLPAVPSVQYDKALAEGVPIATGVMEGTRHLVEDRMNLTGARSRLTGAEAVVRLRALRSSNDFDAYCLLEVSRATGI